MLKWGICCCGSISQDFVTAIVEAKDSKVQISSVAARDGKRAKEFAEKFGIPNYFGSYEELAKSEDVDIVYIGSVNIQHLPQIKLFLNHNKHVLVEKPMCLDVQQTKEAIQLARSKKLFLMEGLWSRCTPVYKAINKIIKDQSLGFINHVNVSFQMKFDDYSHITDKSIGGSILKNVGIYNIQFALLAFPNCELTKIESNIQYLPNGVDKCGQILLEFDGNKTAFIDFHIDAAGKKAGYIYGDKGSIELPKQFWCPEEMILNGTLIETFHDKSKIHSSYNFSNGWLFIHEARHVVDCISKGMTESDLIPLDESLKIAEIMEKALSQ